MATRPLRSESHSGTNIPNNKKALEFNGIPGITVTVTSYTSWLPDSSDWRVSGEVIREGGDWLLPDDDEIDAVH